MVKANWRRKSRDWQTRDWRLRSRDRRWRWWRSGDWRWWWSRNWRWWWWNWWRRLICKNSKFECDWHIFNGLLWYIVLKKTVFVVIKNIHILLLCYAYILSSFSARYVFVYILTHHLTFSLTTGNSGQSRWRR